MTITFEVFIIDGNVAVGLFFTSARVIVNVCPAVCHAFNISLVNAVITHDVIVPTFIIVLPVFIIIVPVIITIGPVISVGVFSKHVHEFVTRSLPSLTVHHDLGSAHVVHFAVVCFLELAVVKTFNTSNFFFLHAVEWTFPLCALRVPILGHVTVVDAKVLF